MVLNYLGWHECRNLQLQNRTKKTCFFQDTWFFCCNLIYSFYAWKIISSFRKTILLEMHLTLSEEYKRSVNVPQLVLLNISKKWFKWLIVIQKSILFKWEINLISIDRFILEPNDPEHLLNKTNNQGWTPLYIAAKYGNLEVVKLLIEKKANYKIKCRVNSIFFNTNSSLPGRSIQIKPKKNSQSKSPQNGDIQKL